MKKSGKFKSKDAASNGASLPPVPGRPRVLVAEENLTSQKVALGILHKLGCRADAVANGLEALEQLERKPYALLLLAVRMPVLDGLKAAAAIRAAEAAGAARLPIIAMAVRAPAPGRERCLAAGMDDCIFKPLEPRAMAGILTKWLQKKPAGSPGFDPSLLRDRLLGDVEMAAAVLAVFAADLPVQLAELEKNIKKGDAAAVRKGGHKLKGAASNVGAEALRAISLEMEDAGLAGDLGAAAALLPRLAFAAAQVLGQIRGTPGAAPVLGNKKGGR